MYFSLDRMRCFFLTLAVVSGAGCAAPPDQAITRDRPPIVVSASGQKLCAIHGVPLKVRPGYGTENYAAGSDVIVLAHATGEPAELMRQNPNALPLTQTLYRDRLHTVPMTVEYCPRCQNAVY